MEERFEVGRIPYVDAAPESDSGNLVELYAEIADLRGSVLNLHRALANQPAALRAFMVMSRHVRDESALPPPLRELAILATAYALDAPYEKFHHVPAARRAGVREEQIASFPEWVASDAFDPLERAVLAYADQVARTRSVDDAVWQILQRQLSRPQLVDLALTVGWYHLCAAVLGPLQIETEDR
jgi:4-carboxymuconolactone decarboxylase